MRKALLFTLLFTAFLSFRAASQITQVGLIGEFNGWSADILMTQDSQIPDLWTVNFSFDKTMAGTDNIVTVKFRANGAWTINWGSTDFPSGIGVLDGPDIPVLIDTSAASTDFFITLNSATGEYNFINLATEAVRGYSIFVDGILDEPEWHLDNTVAKLVNGAFTADPNVVKFGVAYSEDTLYVGLSVMDGLPTLYEMGEVFIDGNHSGGAYDANDLHLRFTGPYVSIIQGPSNLTANFGFTLITGGYSAELAIPLVDLGFVPTPGTPIGFDIIFGDGDSGTQVDYLLAWSGSLDNYVSADSFGTLGFVDQAGLDDRVPMDSFCRIFPNPASGNIYVEINGDDYEGAIEVVISDLAGRTILNHQYQVTASGNLIRVDASRLVPGIYMVSILDSKGNMATRKLMVSGK